MTVIQPDHDAQTFSDLDPEVAAVVGSLYRPDLPPLTDSPFEALHRAVDSVTAKMKRTAGLARRATVEHHTLVGEASLPIAVYSLAEMVDGVCGRVGEIDILVNSTAGNFRCPTIDLSPNGRRTVIDIDLTGTFLCSTAVARKMIPAGGGVILNITGGNNVLTHGDRMAAAGAAKAGIDHLTRSLAKGVGTARHPGERTRAGCHQHPRCCPGARDRRRVLGCHRGRDLPRVPRRAIHHRRLRQRRPRLVGL